MDTEVAVSGKFVFCAFESLEFARFRRPLASLSPLWYVAHTSEAISLASEATSLAHVTCTCGGMLCICMCADAHDLPQCAMIVVLQPLTDLRE